MKTGMLWFDDSKQPLKEKMALAAKYYSEKYGQAPTLCFVHPSALDGHGGGGNGVAIRQARFVMPGYLWLGVGLEDSPKSNGKRSDRQEGLLG